MWSRAGLVKLQRNSETFIPASLVERIYVRENKRKEWCFVSSSLGYTLGLCLPKALGWFVGQVTVIYLHGVKFRFSC